MLGGRYLLIRAMYRFGTRSALVIGMDAIDRVLMSERADSVCDAVAAWPDRLRTMSRDELDAWERDYEAGRETEPSADDLECGI